VLQHFSHDGQPFCCALAALLIERFNRLGLSHTYIRLGIDSLALGGCGLFTAAAFLGWSRDSDTSKGLQRLAATGPVAMLSVDERGAIEQMAAQVVKN
jgi:hypothetical protein